MRSIFVNNNNDLKGWSNNDTPKEIRYANRWTLSGILRQIVKYKPELRNKCNETWSSLMTNTMLWHFSVYASVYMKGSHATGKALKCQFRKFKCDFV